MRRMIMNNSCIKGISPKIAPWNLNDNEPKKIKVAVTLTLSKEIEIYVDDYEAEDNIDEEGYQGKSYDFSNCDLDKALREQVVMPHEAYEKLQKCSSLAVNRKTLDIIEDLKGLEEDSYDIELD